MTTDQKTGDLPAPPAAAAPRPGAHDAEARGSALRVPGYRWLWASGWLWAFTRWMAMFLCSYLVNRLTGSPLLVQLVGAAFFAPLFFGGILGGVISDRFDRRVTIMRQLTALAPVALLMGVVVATDRVQLWMIYTFMLAVGIGGVLDMTSRRALVFDLVGARGITNAMALESVAQTGGAMLGSLAAGAIINSIGIGQVFFVVAAAYAAAWLCMSRMRPPPREYPPTAGASIRQQVGEGLRYVRGHRPIIGIIGVTVLMNFFCFSYMPMVPVFADRLEVNAFWAGVLASATQLGALAAALLLATWSNVRWRGWIYIGGSGVALLSLGSFALISWYPAALLALVATGCGQAGFAAMQGSLILTAAGPAMRGRAMGVLSMAIGALPFGMALLGLVAQLIGPAPAVIASVVTGFTGLVLWTARSPELRRIA